MSTIAELLEKKCSGSGLESREYGRREPSRWPRGTLYPQKLPLPSSTSGYHSVGTVRSWTMATEFFYTVVDRFHVFPETVEVNTWLFSSPGDRVAKKTLQYNLREAFEQFNNKESSDLITFSVTDTEITSKHLIVMHVSCLNCNVKNSQEHFVIWNSPDSVARRTTSSRQRILH
jgi:hypothetical protein